MRWGSSVGARDLQTVKTGAFSASVSLVAKLVGNFEIEQVLSRYFQNDSFVSRDFTMRLWRVSLVIGLVAICLRIAIDLI